MVSKSQQEVCERFGVTPVPTPDDLKVGLALGGNGPLPGLRHPPKGETAGWYIWRGELSSADDFAPLHAAHLAERVPETLPYLALPPGWRFLLAPDREDVWDDQALLDVGESGV